MAVVDFLWLPVPILPSRRPGVPAALNFPSGEDRLEHLSVFSSATLIDGSLEPIHIGDANTQGGDSHD